MKNQITGDEKHRASRTTPRAQAKSTRRGQVTRKARIKPAIPGLNVRLLRKVQKHIVKVPTRLAMGVFSIDNPDNECGTSACIAGWALMLSGKTKQWMSGASGIEIINESKRVLGITGSFFDDTSPMKRLFYYYSWPEPFRSQFIDAEFNPRREASVASKRIDYFIKEGE